MESEENAIFIKKQNEQQHFGSIKNAKTYETKANSMLLARDLRTLKGNLCVVEKHENLKIMHAQVKTMSETQGKSMCPPEET